MVGMETVNTLKLAPPNTRYRVILSLHKRAVSSLVGLYLFGGVKMRKLLKLEVTDTELYMITESLRIAFNYNDNGYYNMLADELEELQQEKFNKDNNNG